MISLLWLAWLIHLPNFCSEHHPLTAKAFSRNPLLLNQFVYALAGQAKPAPALFYRHH